MGKIFNIQYSIFLLFVPFIIIQGMLCSLFPSTWLGTSFVVVPVFAADQLAYDPSQIESLTDPLGEQATVPSLAGAVIKSVLSIVGSIALVIFIYGGVRWMTARGNAEQSKSAAQTMLWAALGVAMIFGSYLILDLVFKAVAK